MNRPGEGSLTIAFRAFQEKSHEKSGIFSSSWPLAAIGKGGYSYRSAATLWYWTYVPNSPSREPIGVAEENTDAHFSRATNKTIA